MYSTLDDMHMYVPFDPDEDPWKRILSCVISIASMVAIFLIIFFVCALCNK